METLIVLGGISALLLLMGISANIQPGRG